MVMRSVVLSLVVVLLVLAAPAARAQQGGNTGDGDAFFGDDTASEEDEGPSGPGSGDGGSNGGVRGYWWVDAVVLEVDGQPCWGLEYTLQPTPPPEHRTEAYWQAMLDAWEDNGVAYDRCPDTDPVFDPGAAALTYWLEIVNPPPPTAEVKPGHAMTGLPAYLEIGGEDRPTWTLDNPIGADVVITATPRYEIDWGDGSPITSTTSRGVPYPGGPGEIVHHYAVSSTYTIEVAAFWTGSWRLANEDPDAARTLPELPVPTTTQLPLEVRQIQAIRDR